MPSIYVANRGALHISVGHVSVQTSGDEVTDYVDVVDLEINFIARPTYNQAAWITIGPMTRYTISGNPGSNILLPHCNLLPVIFPSLLSDAPS